MTLAEAEAATEAALEVAEDEAEEEEEQEASEEEMLKGWDWARMEFVAVEFWTKSGSRDGEGLVRDH